MTEARLAEDAAAAAAAEAGAEAGGAAAGADSGEAADGERRSLGRELHIPAQAFAEKSRRIGFFGAPPFSGMFSEAPPAGPLPGGGRRAPGPGQRHTAEPLPPHPQPDWSRGAKEGDCED